MSEEAIISVPQETAGGYVAFASWNSKEIIAYDKDLSEVFRKSDEAAIKKPIIMFVRDPNVTYIF